MKSQKNTVTEISLSNPALSWHPTLYVDKKGKHCYPKWDLKNRLIADLEDQINDRIDAVGISGEERQNLLSELFKNLTRELPQVDLPPKAPMLYKDREDKSQTAEQFTREHYAAFFGKGLTRATLKQLDKSLYGMLMKGGFPESLRELIPAAQGKGGGGNHSKGGSKPVFSDEELAERTRSQARERMRRYRQRKANG